MKKVYISNEQIEEIKYLYENTLYTIEDLSHKYNVSWCYMSKLIHNNNIVKPEQLKKQILSKVNKRNQNRKTPEQRSQIAKERWKHISEQDKKLRYEKVSKSSKATWLKKSPEEKQRLYVLNFYINYKVQRLSKT